MRVFPWPAGLAALMLLWGCDAAGPELHPPEELPPAVFQVRILGPDTLRTAAGDGALLLAGIEARDEPYPYEPRFLWGARNAAVATVDEHGVVTGRGIGATHVVVTLRDPYGVPLSRDSILVAVEWEKVIAPGVLHPYARPALAADGRLFLDARGQVLTSRDRGATWEPVALSMPGRLPLTSVKPSPQRAGWLVAAGYDAAHDTLYPFVTDDGGQTWRRFEAEAHGRRYAPGSVAFGAGGLYGLTADRASVLHTPDAGRSWTVTPVAQGWPQEAYTLLADPVRPGVLLTEGYEVGRSEDGGRTWQPVPAFGEPYRFLHVDPAGRMYAQVLRQAWHLRRVDPRSGDVFEMPFTSGSHMAVDSAPDDERCLVAALNDGEVFVRPELALGCADGSHVRRIRFPTWDGILAVRVVRAEPFEVLVTSYAFEDVSLWRFVEYR